MEEKYVRIGRTKKPHGIGGELKLHIEDQYAEDFDNTEVVFLEIGGNPTPFFVENVRGELFPILKFEDIDSRDAALTVAQKNMLLRESDIIATEDRTYEEEPGMRFKRLAGYMIHDETVGEVGKIEEVVEMPQQEMAVILTDKKEILIPLNDSLILEIADDLKVVKMDLPEGLLTLWESKDEKPDN